MPEGTVPVALPWYWKDLEPEVAAERMRQLAEWVSWFVDRHHLTGKVPPCWYRHPGLVDELRALFYEHQQVCRPVVPRVRDDFFGAPRPEEPKVAARHYRGWHEARWRWTVGSLADARGYRECLARHCHIEDEPHREDAASFAKETQEGLEESIASGALWR